MDNEYIICDSIAIYFVDLYTFNLFFSSSGVYNTRHYNIIAKTITIGMTRQYGSFGVDDQFIIEIYTLQCSYNIYNFAV